MTFEHYARLYLTFKEGDLKTSTFDKYKGIIEKRFLISGYFSDKSIQEIKTSDIKLWLLSIKDVSSKSKRHYLGVLKGIFDIAYFDDIIEKNPVSKIKLPKYDKPIINPFTSEQVQMILFAVENDNFHAYLQIAFFTGMRSGEIIALKKEDIDLNNRIIKVRRSRSRFGESTPKTRGSIRDVPILDVLYPFISKLYEKHDHEYLFKTQYDQPYRDTNVFVNKYWIPLLSDLGLSYRRPYTTRHTYATNMLYKSLCTPVELAQLLGHTSTEMVYNVYVAYLEQNLKQFDRSISIYG